MTDYEKYALAFATRCACYVNIIRDNVPLGASIVDLGCGTGAYSHALAAEGYDVLGVEGRTANFVKCKRREDGAGLPNLRYIQKDVRDIAGMQFDVVLCCGILYHMDSPRQELVKFSAMARKLIIVDTHFARRGDGAAFTLRGLERFDGVEGRMFREVPPLGVLSKDDDNIWSAIDNTQSFWMTRASIVWALKKNGFQSVSEVYDALGDDGDLIAESIDSGFDRALFTGVRRFE